MASNPLSVFIKEHCKITPHSFCNYGELYTLYIKYLAANKKRRIKSTDFKKALEDEGLWVEKTSKKINDAWINGYWVEGLDICDFCDICATNLYLSLPMGDGERMLSQMSQKSQNQPSFPVENIQIKPMEWDKMHIHFTKCAIYNCSETESNIDLHGVPYCKKHWEEMGCK
jgi:hypothetical protein